MPVIDYTVHRPYRRRRFLEVCPVCGQTGIARRVPTTTGIRVSWTHCETRENVGFHTSVTALLQCRGWETQEST